MFDEMNDDLLIVTMLTLGPIAPGLHVMVTSVCTTISGLRASHGLTEYSI